MNSQRDIALSLYQYLREIEYNENLISKLLERYIPDAIPDENKQWLLGSCPKELSASHKFLILFKALIHHETLVPEFQLELVIQEYLLSVDHEINHLEF